MSKSLNRIGLIGHLGADPEIRTTTSGTQVANLSIATNDGWGDREKTNWHRCTAFGKLAGVIEQHLSKGDRVYVDGRMDYDSYERDGVTIPTAKVIVDTLIMLGGQNQPSARPDPAPSRSASDDSDLPF